MRAIIIILFLTSCHHLHEGRVVKKVYEPERSYQYCTTVLCGKVAVTQWHTGIDDEDFIVKVKGIYKGEYIEEDFYIDKKHWECLRQGDHFNDTIPCSSADEN